jgi:hypothetical protein
MKPPRLRFLFSRCCMAKEGKEEEEAHAIFPRLMPCRKCL